jgi:ABC-2 type transport system ATP-binding protein
MQRGLSASAVPIRTQQLCKTYGTVTALEDLVLEVRAGEIVGLLGPNGAGKTTTLKLLLGMLRPTRGQAQVFGLDCNADSLNVKRVLGYVPDEPAFYEFLTGHETLAFVAQVRGLSRRESLERLMPVISDFEFDTDLTRLIGGYSQGMKKKLAILTALLHEPKLLLLDEPTNGLDPPSAAMVKKVLQTMAARGVAVLLSTHLLDMADKLCDRAVMLHKGKLLFEGAPGALKERAGVGEDGSLEDAFLQLIGYKTKGA